MSISCTLPCGRWKVIHSSLETIQTPNKIRVAKLKGLKKRQARANITLIGRSKVSRQAIPHIMRLIAHECNNFQGDDEVTLLLDEQIYQLIQRLCRRRHSKTKRSTPILTAPIL